MAINKIPSTQAKLFGYFFLFVAWHGKWKTPFLLLVSYLVFERPILLVTLKSTPIFSAKIKGRKGKKTSEFRWLVFSSMKKVKWIFSFTKQKKNPRVLLYKYTDMWHNGQVHLQFHIAVILPKKPLNSKTKSLFEKS